MMKKITMICAAMILSGYTATKAQAVLDKIDRVSGQADRANNTAGRTKTTGDKIMGFFGKKNKDGTEAAGTKTTIKITGATLATLTGINTKIQNIKGVTGSKMKFSSSGGSSITVQHAGTTDELLKSLQKTSPDVFKEKNIEGLDDGEITVKIN